MSLFDIFQSVLTTHFNLVSIFQQFPELCYVKVLMLSQNFCNRSLRVKNFVCFQYLMIQFSGIHHFNGVVLSLSLCRVSGLPVSQVLAVRLTGGGRTQTALTYFPPARDKLFISHNFCPLKLRCATKMVG